MSDIEKIEKVREALFYGNVGEATDIADSIAAQSIECEMKQLIREYEGYRNY